MTTETRTNTYMTMVMEIESGAWGGGWNETGAKTQKYYYWSTLVDYGSGSHLCSDVSTLRKTWQATVFQSPLIETTEGFTSGLVTWPDCTSSSSGVRVSPHLPNLSTLSTRPGACLSCNLFLLHVRYTSILCYFYFRSSFQLLDTLSSLALSAALWIPHCSLLPSPSRSPPPVESPEVGSR